MNHTQKHYLARTLPPLVPEDPNDALEALIREECWRMSFQAAAQGGAGCVFDYGLLALNICLSAAGGVYDEPYNAD